MSYSITNGVLDSSYLVEEEMLRRYKAEHFYPVKKGELFQDRYKVIGKLGYGSASTVWLCRDLHEKEKKYVALKVYINSSLVHREVPVYQHINSIESSEHPGPSYIRKLLDSFEVEGPDGKHMCLVHEALGLNLEEVKEIHSDRVLDAHLVRYYFRSILPAMDFLHSGANVIHTDIQPKNILLGIVDNSAFIKYEQFEEENPTPRKELPDRTIYCSRRMLYTKGLPRLSDFSEARLNEPQNSGIVMPELYRAPEVVLGMPWSYPTDIWGLAMTFWDLLEPKHLFDPYDDKNRYCEHRHLAQMVAIMGPPPTDFLERSKKTRMFWDATGNWKGAVPIPDISLPTAEKRFDDQEQSRFLTFFRKMLQWKPEDRCDLADLSLNEWFQDDFNKSAKGASA